MGNCAASEYDMRADYDVFLRELESLMRKLEGRFVVIHQQRVVADRATLEEAIKYGYHEYGAGSFIAQEVREEQPQVISYSLLV